MFLSLAVSGRRHLRLWEGTISKLIAYVSSRMRRILKVRLEIALTTFLLGKVL